MIENSQNSKPHQRRCWLKGIHHSFNITLLLVLCTSLLIPSTIATTSCTHHEYWDSNVNECIPCTKCNRHQIVIRPCQRHLDTVCRPINSVDIDWNKSMATASERSSYRRVRISKIIINDKSSLNKYFLWTGTSSINEYSGDITTSRSGCCYIERRRIITLGLAVDHTYSCNHRMSFIFHCHCNHFHQLCSTMEENQKAIRYW